MFGAHHWSAVVVSLLASTLVTVFVSAFVQTTLCVSGSVIAADWGYEELFG